ncbi:MAG: hypothetical protein V2I33_22140 [Kangiellaceae bacterium]|nr:hypothetical protein [Kangiellaceae bacterium]
MYSGHDTSLVSYLLGLDSTVRIAPPFASNIVIELDDANQVTIKYNDALLQLPGCKGACPLDSFQAILAKRIVPNLAEACEGTSKLSLAFN